MPLLGKGINFASGSLVGTNKPLDTKYGPYTNVAEAISEVTSTYRHKGLVLGVLNSLGAVREYWFRDGVNDSDLVEKNSQVPSFSYTPEPALVTVTLDNHGLSVNSVIKISGADPSVLNRTVSVNSVIDADTFTYVPPDRPEVQATVTIISNSPLLVGVNFPTKIGLLYQAEWRKITNGTWAPIGSPVAGTGATLTVQRSPTPGSESYRVSVVNAVGPISINTDNPIDFPRKLHLTWDNIDLDVGPAISNFLFSISRTNPTADGRPQYEYGIFKLRYVDHRNQWEIWGHRSPMFSFLDSRFVTDPTDLNGKSVVDGPTVVGTCSASPYYKEPDAANQSQFLRSDGAWADLPAYLDDVREFDEFSLLPVPGTAGILYVTKDDNRAWRWVSTETGYVAVGGSNTGLDPEQFATHSTVEHMLKEHPDQFTAPGGQTDTSYEIPTVFSPSVSNKHVIVNVPSQFSTDFTLRLPAVPVRLDGTRGGKLSLVVNRVTTPGGTNLRRIRIFSPQPQIPNSWIQVAEIPFGGTAFSGTETNYFRFFSDLTHAGVWRLDMSPSGIYPYDGSLFWSGRNAWKKPLITEAGDWQGGAGPYTDGSVVSYDSAVSGFTPNKNLSVLAYNDSVVPVTGWPANSLREKFRKSSRSSLTIYLQPNLPAGDAGGLYTESFNFIIAKQNASDTRLQLPYVSSLEAGNNVGDRIIVSWNKYTAGGNLDGKIIFQRLFGGFYTDFCELFAGEYIVFESVKSSLNDNRFWEITSRGTLESGSRSESEAEGFAIAMALAL